jgi:acyl carrier protein
MPGDPTLVNGRALDALVREIVADVLVVPAESVAPGVALMRDLGAESIDFMDLVFRLEDALAIDIPYSRWQRFLETHLPGGNLAESITAETVQAFAEAELVRS